MESGGDDTDQGPAKAKKTRKATSRKKATRSKVAAKKSAKKRPKRPPAHKGGRTDGSRGPQGTYIDPAQLRRMSQIGLSQADIATILDMTERNLEIRIAADLSLQAVQQRCKAEMRFNLRSVAYSMALRAGDPGAPGAYASMLQLLLKQPERVGGCGMSERTVNEVEFPQLENADLEFRINEKLDLINRARASA